MLIDEQIRCDFLGGQDLLQPARDAREDAARPALIVRAERLKVGSILGVDLMGNDCIVCGFVDFQPAILIRMTLRQDDVANEGRGDLLEELASSVGIPERAGIHQNVPLRGRKQVAVAHTPALIDAARTLDGRLLVFTGLDQLCDPQTSRG